MIVERDAHLEAVKVYSRDPVNADPIYTKEVSRVCPPFKATDTNSEERE